MGKIIVSLNVTLDGVVQDPDGQEGSAGGGWYARSFGCDREEWSKVFIAEADAARALLLGRRSDEWFASRWLSRTGAWADRLNSMPKYVVSSSLAEPQWGNSTVLKGDLLEEVSSLKQELDGEIVVYGSIRLARALFEHELLDELRLLVFPVVAGAGERLFDGTGAEKVLRLAEARTVGGSLVLLTYRTFAAAA